MTGVLSAFFAQVVIITYRGVKGGTSGPIKGLPLPADYVGATIIYGALGLLGGTQAAPVATLAGWGLVVATLVNLWTPKNPTQLASHGKAGGTQTQAAPNINRVKTTQGPVPIGRLATP